MATARQIEANRRNASGPHKMTDAGKQAVKGNAIRHGLATRVHVVLTGEDQDFYNEILESLRAEYAPSTTQEELLVHQIAENYWRLVRSRNMESGSLLQVEADYASQYGIKSGAKDDLTRGAILGMAFSKNGKMFDKLSRYQATAERSYYRAIRETPENPKDQIPTAAQSEPRPSGSGNVRPGARTPSHKAGTRTYPNPRISFCSAKSPKPHPTRHGNGPHAHVRSRIRQLPRRNHSTPIFKFALTYNHL